MTAIGPTLWHIPAQLHTWPQALAARERVYHTRALKLFFPLFALVMTRALPAEQASDAEATDGKTSVRGFEARLASYIGNLHAGLDEFVQSCALGEVGTRLEMLAALQAQLEVEIGAGIAASESSSSSSDSAALSTPSVGADAMTVDGSGSANKSETETEAGAENETAVGLRLTLGARQRIARTLFNVRLYYAQFLPLIQVRARARLSSLVRAEMEESFYRPANQEPIFLQGI